MSVLCKNEGYVMMKHTDEYLEELNRLCEKRCIKQGNFFRSFFWDLAVSVLYPEES